MDITEFYAKGQPFLNLITSAATQFSSKRLTIIRVASSNPSQAFQFLINMTVVLIFRFVIVVVRLMATDGLVTEQDTAMSVLCTVFCTALH